MKPQNTEGKIAPQPCATGKHVLGTCACTIGMCIGKRPAQSLFEAAFSSATAREPRSKEYKAGVLALLKKQVEGEAQQLVTSYSGCSGMSDDLLLDNFHWVKVTELTYLTQEQGSSHDIVHGVWSLLDMINEFDLISLQDIFSRLHYLEASFDAQRELGMSADEASINTAKSLMTESEAYCEQQAFHGALEVIQRVIFGFKFHPRDFSTMAAEVRHVRDAMMDECSKRTFVEIAPDLATYVNDSEWMGPGVTHYFPSAALDIKEAGNCLATDSNTAAVFHMMRAVEWGLRALCEHLGLRRAARRTKGGKKKYTPIPYADWETMLNQLPDLVDAKIEKLKRGKGEQEAQEFYYPVIQDIRGIRDAWRNHVMHTRASYNRKDAEAIASHVKRLMMLLTDKVQGS